MKDLILKGKVHFPKETMADSYNEGIRTFGHHIFDLCQSSVIDYNNTIAYADSPNDLRLKIKISEMKTDEKEKHRHSS